MDYETLLIERQKGVASVTLNRPTKLNALNSTMAEELRQVIKELEADREIRAILFTGAGRAFCAGGDVKELAKIEKMKTNEIEQFVRFGDLLIWDLINLEKPTIAAINGVAVGGGCCLAMGCDIRLASTETRLGVVFVKRGISGADLGATWLLPRLVGAGWAAQLLLTGDIIEASLAERIGLVNQVFPPDKLMPAAHELAEQLAAGPPLALKVTKRALKHSLYRGMAEHLDLEGMIQTFCFRTEDQREGVKSFLEKREASFKGE